MASPRTLTLISLMTAAIAPASAIQAACDPDVGGFVSLSGMVQVQSTSNSEWVSAELTTRLCEGDSIRVGDRSRAAIALRNDAVLRVDQATTIRLLDIAEQGEEKSLLELVKGAMQSFSRKPRKLTINTPYLNGSIEGTEFLARVADEATEFTLYEGKVVTVNEQGSVVLEPGQAARAAAGEAPRMQLVVKPRQQAQWALYYPPVLSQSAGGDGALQRAGQCAAQGDSLCAFAALDGIAVDARDAEYFVTRAATLVSVGRTDEAGAALVQALVQSPDNARALALRAVIAVVTNEQETGLADARRAVAVDPTGSAGNIALSYALQAALDLPAARDALVLTVAAHPDEALAWARLAELHLMLGARRAAVSAARKAAELRPELGRTQTVLGFAALAEIRIAEAQAAFERAIAADSADPLSRLGLGLARIRGGKLADGRRDLEAAAALDGTHAVLRAYLGKAYFEERRSPLDGEQFAIARELDPNDPTAYLYDALRLQSSNRPVEAFQALQGSIERNGNRAVYRSRLLLDADRAARGSSLARVYKDLGFDQLGINAATQSLGFDPSNASAHRFLSDTYRDSVERTEISRVSELLQAQLLQDVNSNPIQPSLSSTNLNIAAAGGPAEAGFNEFTSLFERNQLKIDGTGFGGSNNTSGGETVISGIWGPVSASGGYFRYDTDGFRPNNDLSHEIWDGYAQWAVVPDLNVQVEFLKRETEHGDLRQNFDLDSGDLSFRRSLDSEVWRTGARYSPDAHSDVLFSYIHSNVDTSGGSVPFELPGVIKITEGQLQNNDGDQFEGQYLFRAARFNITAGAAHGATDVSGLISATAQIPPLPDDVQIFPVNARTRDTRGYVYTDVKVLPTVLATIGLSYQDYDEQLTSDGISNAFSRWLPKVGVRWDLTPTLSARAAYFKTIKPILVSNRTVEPTQVAGFNQFFDDPDATRTERYGAGLDWRPLGNLHLGTEVTRRELESPTIDLTARAVHYEDRDEWLHRAYLYWEPTLHWALSAEGSFDKFDNVGQSQVASIVPDKVVTWTMPLKATYFANFGGFASAGVTYIDQSVRRDAAQSTLAQGDSRFALVDLGIGYRVPGRHGVLSLVVENLLDKNFHYQDNNYRTFSEQPYISPYVPERTIMGRVTLSY